MINKTIKYSAPMQDLYSKLTLNTLKQLIEPFKDTKILAGVTCKREFYHYLSENAAKKEGFDGWGTEVYVINNQEEQVKYFYDKDKLREYLKKNT